MGKPYSIDLRERVVRAVEQKGMSRRAAAARFGVSVSAAINWVKRKRLTGSVAPGQMGGHKPKPSAMVTATGCLSAASGRISPCAGLLANWLNTV